MNQTTTGARGAGFASHERRVEWFEAWRELCEGDERRERQGLNDDAHQLAVWEGEGGACLPADESLPSPFGWE